MNLSVQSYTLESEIPLPRHKVWDLLSNTDRLNQMIGLSPVTFSDVQFQKNVPAYREMVSQTIGFYKMRWKEYPFEWVKERRYAVEREYSNGPLKRLYGGILLEDADSVLENGEKATKVQVFADFTPSHFLGAAAIPLIGKSTLRKTLDYLQNYMKLADAGRPDELPRPPLRSKANQAVLEERLSGLRELSFSKRLIDKLQDYLINGSDEETAGIRPYELADEWNVDREELLKLFLHATKEGVLNLSWELMCPNCRVPKVQVRSLAELNSAFHCDLCGIEYEANFDRYVELHFSVAPMIRKARRNYYCIGGPVATPHIYVQKRVYPGQSIDLPLPNVQSKWRIRVLGKNDMLEVREEQTAQPPARYTENGWEETHVSLSEEYRLATIENESEETIVIVLEKTEWDRNAVTAAKVTAMQEFRDLFSSEVLAPGQQIKIENVTVLFSDLKGSTALYEVVGDAHAYSNVRRHFDYMSKWVRTHSGSVVKTMGDAVMAVFHNPEDAVKAAYAIYENLESFNAGLAVSERISVKIGIHGGPAIVVNSNDVLDYFGRTVNIASRIQGESDGKAFVVSEELFRSQSVAAFFEDHSAEYDFLHAELKGIDETVKLVKISL